MITKDGVCYDFNISPFKYRVEDLTYVFSSMSHLEKFKKRLKENRDKINKSLSNRFNINVNIGHLPDIALYKKIETRGFLIITADGAKICQNKIIFVGGKAIIRE